MTTQAYKEKRLKVIKSKKPWSLQIMDKAESVQVKLELGHRATFREKPTAQGFTHDWVVFVRGPGNESSIQHFVDKVVFHLHESFPKARRVVKDYPFQVAEVGYAGFLMPIEVHFKNKEEPKKVIFQYDLFLHLEGQPPINHIRCEKLTFNNPTEDFRRKLIKSGGVGILETDGSPAHSADKPSELSTYKPHSSASSIQYKVKQESEEKYSSTAGKPPKPIKEHQEVKTAWREPKAASKGPKSASKEPKSVSKEPKSASKESKSASKEPKSASKDLKSASKEPKSNSKIAQKPSGKRPPSSSPPPSSGSSSSQDGTKKRRRSTSNKDKSGSSKQGTSDKSSDKQSSGEKSKGKNKSGKSKASVKQNLKKESEDSLFAPEIVVERRKKVEKKEPPKVLPLFEAELSTEEVDNDDMDVPSPSSSISFSSLPRGGGKGALNTLMHEIDENDDDFDDQDIVTPFQTDFSNHHSVSNNLNRDYGDNSSRSSSVEREKDREKVREKDREKDKEKDREKDKEKVKEKSKSKSNNSRKSSCSNGSKKGSKSERKPRNSESGSKQKPQSQSNHDYLTELVLLHRKLMSLSNRDQIQRIVDLIGDTDHFQISDNSFDFDLCSLDKTTVKKLQECVAPL